MGFTIFLLKLLLGSLLFLGMLLVLRDSGRGDCGKLEEVEYLLEECSSRRLLLEKREEEKAESVEQMKMCERKVERQAVKLEEAKVKMEDTRRAFGARVAQQVAREAEVKNTGDEEELWAAIRERDRLLELRERQLEAAKGIIEKFK